LDYFAQVIKCWVYQRRLPSAGTARNHIWGASASQAWCADIGPLSHAPNSSGRTGTHSARNSASEASAACQSALAARQHLPNLLAEAPAVCTQMEIGT